MSVKYLPTPAMIIMLTGFTSPSEKTVIYTIGDSTMANKTAEVYPETGWGQVLHLFVNDSVLVSNHAVNGRNTKSFISEGRWKTVVEKLKPGEYPGYPQGKEDNTHLSETGAKKVAETVARELFAKSNR